MNVLKKPASIPRIDDHIWTSLIRSTDATNKRDHILMAQILVFMEEEQHTYPTYILAGKNTCDFSKSVSLVIW